VAAPEVDLVVIAGLTVDGITVGQAISALFGVDGVNERAVARKRPLRRCEAGELDRAVGQPGRYGPDRFRPR
jgi:hypothetical protein